LEQHSYRRSGSREGVKIPDIRQNLRKPRFVNTEPQREFGEELIDTGGWNETTAAGIQRIYFGALVGIHCEERVLAIDFFTFHRAAENDLVSAPGVVGTAAVARESATKVGSGEKRHLILNAEVDERVVKSGESGTELREHFV